MAASRSLWVNAAGMIRSLTRRLGFDIVKYPSGDVDGELPPDFEQDDRLVWARVKAATMTSPERIYALCRAIEYVTRHRIPGAVVECGVWRGGSMMAVALTLLRLRDQARQLFLFDTFSGMPPPGTWDRSHRGEAADDEWRRHQESGTEGGWCQASLEEVRRNLLGTGYDAGCIHLVEGRVEDTIPSAAPETIALLRLDTDWYASTKHELEQLFPRLSPGGVLIVDDYGHWQGARKAIDEYLNRHDVPVLLNRIDYTGRIGLKAP